MNGQDIYLQAGPQYFFALSLIVFHFAELKIKVISRVSFL